MMRTYAGAIALLTALLLAACDSEPSTEPPPEGWLAATVEGAAAVSYQGSGYFVTFEPPIEVPAWFTVVSVGRAGSDAAEFYLQGPMEQRPAPGRYDVGLVEDPSSVFRAVYLVEHGDSIMRYTVTGGEVEITESTDEAVAGTFDLDAVDGVLCSKEWPDFEFGDEGPVPPCHVHAAEARTEVRIHGSFRTTALGMCELPAGAEDTGMSHLRPVQGFCVRP